MFNWWDQASGDNGGEDKRAAGGKELEGGDLGMISFGGSLCQLSKEEKQEEEK